MHIRERKHLSSMIENYVKVNRGGMLDVNFDEKLFNELYAILHNQELKEKELLVCLRDCFRYPVFYTFWIDHNLL